MIALIVFKRKTQSLIRCDEYADADRRAAEAERLRLEIQDHRNKSGLEIVILEAASIDAMKATHGRYFGTIGA